MASIDDEVFLSLEGSVKSCEKLITESYKSLQRLWDEVGIPNEQLASRRRVVYDNFEGILSQMIDEEQAMRDSYFNNIIKCREECVRLSSELETNFTEADEDWTVIKKEKHFRSQIKQLLKEKQLKLKEAMELRTKEGELCVRLGREPEYIPSDTLLSNEQFKEINTRIGFLSAEKKKREIKLAISAKDIIDLWTLLNIKAKTTREEIIESGELDSFQLSNENMEWLETTKTNLKLHLEENRSIHVTLLTKLKSLWARMELDEAEQKLFLDQHIGYSDAVIVKLKEEVHRLEELKLQNIKSFIESTRNEISRYWDLLFYNDDDRKLFGPFYSDNFGEHCLELHEQKLESLIKEYNENEEMYKLIKSRNVMWNKWEEIESRESDPNRFANRGGNLLKEEKERKLLQKQLPKQEELIVKAISEWESSNDRIFTVFGHTFNDFVNNQKQELQEKKDQMKENKQRQREEAMQKDLTYGSTPAKTPKRRIAGTQILTPASKRTKTAVTPSGTPSKATPLRSGRTPRPRQFIHSSLVSRSPIRTPGKEKQFPRVVVKVPTPNTKRPDTPVKRGKRPAPPATPSEPAPRAPGSDSAESMDSGIVSTLDLDNNNVDSYAEFEKELSLPARDLLRSSAIHESPIRGTGVRKSLLQTIQEADL